MKRAAIFLKNLRKSLFSASSESRRRKDIHLYDQIFYYILCVFSWLAVLLFVSLLVLVFIHSLPALKKLGLSFFITSGWDSWKENFGVLALVWGTLVTSFLALLIAVPVSVGVALFLNELAPGWLARPLHFVLEMLAAIPSIVYGLWGLFILAPWLRGHIQPFLGEYFSFLPFFQGPQYGIGMLCAGVVLAIMITPTIASICKEVFSSIPRDYRESVLGVGATRWEMLRIAVLKGGRVGVLGAVIMGLGRALGETMAVTMVVGNKISISLSIFEPAQTMASVLANQYAEADSSLHLSALTAVGLALFMISIIVHSSTFWFSRHTKKSFSKGFV